MKSNTHPQYHPNAKIRCACGKEFSVGSTKESMEVEICSNCHPLFTGKEKIIDTAGRVEKFKKRLERQKSMKDKKTRQ